MARKTVEVSDIRKQAHEAYGQINGACYKLSKAFVSVAGRIGWLSRKIDTDEPNPALQNTHPRYAELQELTKAADEIKAALDRTIWVNWNSETKHLQNIYANWTVVYPPAVAAPAPPPATLKRMKTGQQLRQLTLTSTRSPIW